MTRRKHQHKDTGTTMSRARRPVLAGFILSIATLISGCQSPTLVVLEDPRTYVEDRSLRDAREDARIRLDIQALFVEPETGALKDVKVEVYEQEVLLVGTTTTPAAREEAGLLAAQVEGIGPIHNEIQVIDSAGLQAAAADLTIETKVKQALRQDKDVNAANLRWHSVNGVVYMFGRALSEAERQKAIAIARGIEGVREVADLLKVAPLPD